MTNPNTQLYADGIGKIRLENGVVKIDLVSLTDHYPSPGAAAQKVPAVTATIVLSPSGFAQALSTMQDMAKSMKTEAKPAPKKKDAPTPSMHAAE